MKFSYSNKRLYLNLTLGIFWLATSLVYLLDEKIKWYVYATLLLASVYIFMFIYEYVQKYVEITKDKIIVNSIPRKEIIISEINEVRYFADDYTFTTANKTLKITKLLINKKQIPQFENFYNTLSLTIKENSAQ